MKNKETPRSKMIKIAVFAFTSLFIGAGIYVVPKSLSKTEQVTATAPTFNSTAPAAEQARLLLRKVMLTGRCSSELPVLDSTFAARVGQGCSITRDQVRSYLNQYHINEWEVGGTIDLPLCATQGGETARYMVIHDTSYPRYKKGFPNNINDDSWEWNRLNRWLTNVTHIFVNRVGDSKTVTPFHEGMTATKLERYVMGDAASRGLYLHIELIQPRAELKGYGRHNDCDAPSPGFSDAQYDRLALLYTIASVRKGEYLIPGFHACVDQGIKYAHDDPQNFELSKFFTALNKVWSDIENPVSGGNRVGSGSGE